MKAIAAATAVLVVFLLAASEPASPGLAGPPSGIYEGRFDGVGRASSFVAVQVAGQWIRDLAAGVPAVCAKNGRTYASTIEVSLSDRRTLHGTNRIESDGSFGFWWRHRADVAKAETYTVWVSGRFTGTSLRGRARAVSSSAFLGACRANRAFDARRSV